MSLSWAGVGGCSSGPASCSPGHHRHWGHSRSPAWEQSHCSAPQHGILLWSRDDHAMSTATAQDVPELALVAAPHIIHAVTLLAASCMAEDSPGHMAASSWPTFRDSSSEQGCPAPPAAEPTLRPPYVPSLLNFPGATMHCLVQFSLSKTLSHWLLRPHPLCLMGSIPSLAPGRSGPCLPPARVLSVGTARCCTLVSPHSPFPPAPGRSPTGHCVHLGPAPTTHGNCYGSKQSPPQCCDECLQCHLLSPQEI